MGSPHDTTVHSINRLDLASTLYEKALEIVHEVKICNHSEPMIFFLTVQVYGGEKLLIFQLTEKLAYLYRSQVTYHTCYDVKAHNYLLFSGTNGSSNSFAKVLPNLKEIVIM